MAAAAAAAVTPPPPPPLPSQIPKNKLETLPCTLPSVDIPDEQKSIAAAVKTCTETLNLASLTEAHFAPEALWRDTIALTGSLRTFYSTASIVKALDATKATRQLRNFAIETHPGAARVMRLPGGYAWVDVWFKFDCAAAPATRCSGAFSLVRDENGSGEWKIWLLRTILDGLTGRQDVDMLEPSGTTDGSGANGHASLEAKAVEHFDCVIVGGGQAGLSTAGRLKALGVTYVVLDEQPRVGDSWNSRYDSVKIHLPRQTAHLPFDPTFPPPYSQYLTRTELAQGYQDWVKKYGIKVWQLAELISGSWDETQKNWTLTVQSGVDKVSVVLSASHVVMCTGGGGRRPLMPTYPGMDKFGGLIFHSSQYKSANEWTGLRGVVVGTANTAHDVAEDMVDANLKSVTMIQRSRTYVFPVKNWTPFSNRLYNDHIPTALADKASLTGPNAVTRLLFKAVLGSAADADIEYHKALEEAGFKTEIYGDLSTHLFIRMGGHYLDMGNCQNIIDGKVKMKSDAAIKCFAPGGIEFSDGSYTPADVVVYATGFAGNMKDVVAQIFGKETASKVDDYWGLDDEGELKGVYKPTGHPRMWYMGGGQNQARYFSRFVALQIEADLLGMPFPIYNETP